MADQSIDARVVSKVRWRLLPFLIVCFFIAFVDRVNVGFAALHMNEELGFTPAIYGFGAGLFFIGYAVFEIPSNLILHRVGARIWIARIMVTWGLLAAAMAFVSGTTSFYVLRFLLGAAEAGFFPGVLLYMTYWFPQEARTRTMATFSAGSVVSLVIGAPVSAALLNLDGAAGLHGWQWLYILEGLPAVALGVAAYFWLTDRPAQATWLADDERRWLEATMRAEAEAKPVENHMSAGTALRDPRTILMSFAIMLNIVCIYGVTLWLPTIVKSVGGLSNMQIGLISAVPFLCTAIAMVINGAHSDRTNERRWHILIWAAIGCGGFMIAATAGSPLVGLVGICLAAMGIWCSNTVFWTVPMRLFTGVSAAASLALVNSIGNLGGFLGPFVTGWVRESFGGFEAALVMLGCSLLIFGLVIFVFLTRQERHAAPALAASPTTTATGA